MFDPLAAFAALHRGPMQYRGITHTCKGFFTRDVALNGMQWSAAWSRWHHGGPHANLYVRRITHSTHCPTPQDLKYNILDIIYLEEVGLSLLLGTSCQ